MKRAVIIGAGPMGLEAALAATERGLDVTVLEQGEPGDALRRWGPTRLFSPLAMNLSPRARALLGDAAPPDDALLTGPEMADRVLAPIAQSPSLRDRVRVGHRVLAVGRARLSRGDYPGHPVRDERPFWLLVDGPNGEQTIEAEVVLDASGVYGQPLPLGPGGLPARGEAKAAPSILRDLGQLHRRRAELAGRRVLLVGHGHSAAHALLVLDALAREAPGTAITWAARTMNLHPCLAVACDPLPERAAVVDRANALAADPPPHLTVERRAHVLSIDREGDALRVELSGSRTVAADCIVALVGARPDLSFLNELALEISPVTEGAARLYRAISSVTDCLSVPRVTATDLASGERNFHLVGAKSYGRARTFLLQTGLAQIETILAGINLMHAH